MSSKLELAAGRRPSAVVESLNQLILQGTNLRGGGIEVGRLRNVYLAWVEGVEWQLRTYFGSAWVWDRLHSARWSEIVHLGPETPRPYPLIGDEANAQVQHLNAIVSHLEAMYVPFELPDGCIAIVPDTNVFLHYRLFTEIDWPSIARADHGRLVVPLMVVEELDSQKFGSRAKLRERARTTLRALREVRRDLPPESPAKVRTGVTLQVLMDPDGHERDPNHDEEILDRAKDLASLVDGRLFVATADYSMEMRGVHRGLKFLQLPDELLLSANGGRQS
jgi:hypothetical protein